MLSLYKAIQYSDSVRSLKAPLVVDVTAYYTAGLCLLLMTV